jgi:hypothetical protein
MGRGIEQAMKLVAENVEAPREALGRRVGEHFVPHVERMLFALGYLFGHQLTATLCCAILCLYMNICRIAFLLFTRWIDSDLRIVWN